MPFTHHRQRGIKWYHLFFIIIIDDKLAIHTGASRNQGGGREAYSCKEALQTAQQCVQRQPVWRLEDDACLCLAQRLGPQFTHWNQQKKTERQFVHPQLKQLCRQHGQQVWQVLFSYDVWLLQEDASRHDLRLIGRGASAIWQIRRLC